MRVRLSNQQSEVLVKVRPLQRQLNAALAHLPRPLPRGLAAIGIVLVDRATIVRVHSDFLDDPTETDVITFPTAIIVCPAVARARAAEFGLGVQEEILLYALHGILHLTGYDDTTPALAKEMARAQMKLLQRIRI